MVDDAHPQPYAAAAPTEGRRNGAAITSLVLGIIGMVLSFWGVVSLAALVFGVVGLQHVRNQGRRGRGLAIAGIVLGAIGVVWGIVSLIFGLQSYSVFVHHHA